MTIVEEWPDWVKDEKGHFDYNKFHQAILKSLEGVSLKDKLIDFDSPGYGPDAMLRYWNVFDRICAENRRLKAELDKR